MTAGRHVVMCGIFALSAFATSARADEHLSLELVPWSRKVADHRFESPRDYEGTIKFYKDKFKGYKTIKWSREVSVPAVKYIHFENTTKNSKWLGVNIYELPDGRVRYYILSRPPAVVTAPGTAAGTAPVPAPVPGPASAPVSPSASSEPAN